MAEQSPYLFPDFKGRQVTHLTRVVTRFAEERSFSLPNSQLVRTSVELKTKHIQKDKNKQRNMRLNKNNYEIK